MAGRPALPEDERRDVTFRIRMTSEERDQLDRAAEKAGAANTSEWAREVIAKAAKRLNGR